MCAGSGQMLPGLEGCKSPNPAALPDGCLGAQPAIGIDQYGLWCAPQPSPQCSIFLFTYILRTLGNPVYNIKVGSVATLTDSGALTERDPVLFLAANHTTLPLMFHWLPALPCFPAGD